MFGFRRLIRRYHEWRWRRAWERNADGWPS